jgi:hypothetical protein
LDVQRCTQRRTHTGQFLERIPPYRQNIGITSVKATIFINSKNMTMPIKAKNTYLQAVLPEQHKEQLKKIAAKEGRSLSSLVAFIVAQWLEQRAKRQ